MKSKAMGADDDDRLLSEKEVSEKFGIGLHPLRDWRHAGAGDGPPVTRIGRRVLYRQGGVRAWLRDLEGGAVPTPPPYEAFCDALRDRDEAEALRQGESEWYFGSAALRDALTLRMAPLLERVFYRSGETHEDGKSILAIVPFPANALGFGAGIDVSSYMEAVNGFAGRHAGVIVAEPGHNWTRHIEEWDLFAPFMEDAPTGIVLYRADRLLRVAGVPASGGVLSPGDELERELSAAARVAGLAFHAESDLGDWRSVGSVARSVVDRVTAQRGEVGA